jgi:type I restriction enzyme, S subunit
VRHALPAGWRKVRLHEVAEQCLGKMLDAAKNKGTPLPYLRNPNVRWFDFDLSDVKEMPFEDREVDRYGLREGDVVICEGGEAGRAAIWDGRLPNVKFQKAIHRVRTGPELHNRFFVHRLMADYHSGRLADYYTGATIKHLTGQDLAQYEFELPPLPEQRRIAEILDKADALRAKRRAALAQLDTLTQSIFLDMFGDPATNPKAWSCASLSELGNVVTGGTPPSAKVGMFGGSIPFVTPGDLETDERVKRSVTEDGASESVTVGPGSVLVCCIGATIGKIGKANVRSAFNQQINAVEWNDLVDADYGYVALRFFKPTIIAWGTSTTLPILKKSTFERIEIPVPPLAKQQAFSAVIRRADRLRLSIRNALACTDELFESLQVRAFRGEL